jgi:ABC-2 type transport system permease protein
MRGCVAVAAREYSSFFRLPLGWVAIALFLFLTGVVFGLLVLVPGQPASLRSFFAVAIWLLLPVAPAISMRLFSEEFRTGTIEPLMTSPVSDLAVVVGKYVGAAAFLVTMIAPTFVYGAVLCIVSDPTPDVGPMVAGYLSLFLTGLLYLAVGTLASSLTSNQTLAFLGTLFVLLAVLVGTSFAPASLPVMVTEFILAMSIPLRVSDFAKGVIDSSHVVFFVTLIVWFVFATMVSVESRRWR